MCFCVFAIGLNNRGLFKLIFADRQENSVIGYHEEQRQPDTIYLSKADIFFFFDRNSFHDVEPMCEERECARMEQIVKAYERIEELVNHKIRHATGDRHDIMMNF